MAFARTYRFCFGHRDDLFSRTCLGFCVSPCDDGHRVPANGSYFDDPENHVSLVSSRFGRLSGAAWNTIDRKKKVHWILAAKSCAVFYLPFHRICYHHVRSSNRRTIFLYLFHGHCFYFLLRFASVTESIPVGNTMIFFWDSVRDVRFEFKFKFNLRKNIARAHVARVCMCVCVCIWVLAAADRSIAVCNSHVCVCYRFETHQLSKRGLNWIAKKVGRMGCVGQSVRCVLVLLYKNSWRTNSDNESVFGLFFLSVFFFSLNFGRFHDSRLHLQKVYYILFPPKKITVYSSESKMEKRKFGLIFKLDEIKLHFEFW